MRGMSEGIRFLMSPPDFYEVEYVINPWMEGNIHKASQEQATRQWQALYNFLKERVRVEIVPPQPNLPDMVFTANAGAVLGRKVVLSRFFHRERQSEEPHLKQWFKKADFELFELPPDLPFEGAGDALMDRGGGWLWAAYGSRTELDAHVHLARFLEVEVCSLRLTDPRFYHLDTCFCPLEGGWLLYYPAAFDTYSNRLIEQRAPKRIPVSEPDAIRFACNAVNFGNTIVLNPVSLDLRAQLHGAGYEVFEFPLGEFMKSGGSAKCLTLRLDEPVPEGARPLCTVQSRKLRLEGHLLDSGLLDRALELTIQSGGSFQIQSFKLGKQRQSTSTAEINVSAPSGEVLDKIAGQLIDLGAVAAPREQSDAELKPVTHPGVAPDDFYATNIYPTEVRIAGRWLRVQDQRMDGIVTVSRPTGAGADGVVARCKLLRDLVSGEEVVVGSSGIRTVRKTEARDARGAQPTEKEFAFMRGEVSSERRVELVVEQISWEMHRIRGQGGRIAVVAGPVVIHTGGGEYLAWLIRNGYVQALLGGNAIAVHDIEQTLFGTSLGLDLKRGNSVRGGHRHHLRAINTIRRCGGIARAVEQGALTSGVFYDCVRNHVPFALAGSIRDDGPLPETEMNLIQAQADCARLIRGAEMILMLSSMLHSIGVGNMTPAGVRLVCVDINPAVVTKLADRGSIESVGVVTDVGLFLNTLTQRLRKLEEKGEAHERVTT